MKKCFLLSVLLLYQCSDSYAQDSLLNTNHLLANQYKTALFGFAAYNASKILDIMQGNKIENNRAALKQLALEYKMEYDQLKLPLKDLDHSARQIKNTTEELLCESKEPTTIPQTSEVDGKMNILSKDFSSDKLPLEWYKNIGKGCATHGGICEFLRGQLHIRQSGAGGCGNCTFIEKNINVTLEQKQVILYVDVKVISSSVRYGTGDGNTEFPAYVGIDFLDKNNKTHRLVIGYAIGRSQRNKQSVFNYPTQFILAHDCTPNEWYRSQKTCLNDYIPNAAKLIRIVLGGQGWDYESYFENIKLFIQNVGDSPYLESYTHYKQGNDDYLKINLHKINHKSGKPVVKESIGSISFYLPTNDKCKKYMSSTRCDLNAVPIKNIPVKAIRGETIYVLRSPYPKPYSTISAYDPNSGYSELKNSPESASELGTICRLILPANIPKDSQGFLGEGGDFHNKVQIVLCSIGDIGGTVLEQKAPSQYGNQFSIELIDSYGIVKSFKNIYYYK